MVCFTGTKGKLQLNDYLSKGFTILMKISTPTPQKDISLNPHPHLSKNNSLASYFPLKKNVLLKPPPPWNFH